MSHRWEKPPNVWMTEIFFALLITIVLLFIKACFETADVLIR